MGGIPDVRMSRYDRLTLAMHPVLFISVEPGRGAHELTPKGCVGPARYRRAGVMRSTARLPDGELAGILSGSDSLTVRSSPLLSIDHTGGLTLEAWIRPATVSFSRTEGSGYVEWLGKGRPGQFEYALRIYSRGNSERRANRISGYAFNLAGGKGSGSYFQDPVRVGAWIMVTVEFDVRATPAEPAGWVEIFKDGVARQRTSLAQFHVVPRAGSAPFAIGSLDGDSFFQGSIAKVAVFDRILSGSAVRAQYGTMMMS